MQLVAKFILWQLQLMREYVNKSRHVSVLIYYFICPAKNKWIVFDEEVDQVLNYVCIVITDHYEFYFLEIWTDIDHVHFLIQSVTMYRPNKIIQKVISSRTREIFRSFASAKKSFGEENFLQMAILSTQLVNILMKRSSVHMFLIVVQRKTTCNYTVYRGKLKIIDVELLTLF